VNKLIVCLLLPLLPLLALLSSCGGGGSGGGGSGGAVASKVTVVDGYITGAIVFLDKNKNGVYDAATEPKAINTNAAIGEYTFKGISAATLALYPVVVTVPLGAVDSDNPNQPIAKMFNMTAPAGGSGVVSPMTSLVHSQILNNPGMTIAQAQAGIKKVMGLPATSTVNLMADYVAQGNAKVRQVAQVVAAVVGSNQAKLQNAKPGGASAATLVDVLVQKALAKLPTIVLKVDTAAANFNLATTASLIGAGAGFQIDVNKLNQQLANQQAKLDKPKITLKGNSVETFVAAAGAVYKDKNATAFSNIDGDISGSITATGLVDLTKVAVYTRTYNVADKVGTAAASVTRTINVIAAKDTVRPSIKLIGAINMTMIAGSTPYVEQGAVAFDNIDVGLSKQIQITGFVNAAVPNVYTVFYDVTDSSGNKAPKFARVITVLTPPNDKTPPVITLNHIPVTGAVSNFVLTDPAVITVVQGSGFTDPGASAVDLFDGAVAVTMSGTATLTRKAGVDIVDTATVGKFTIIYDAFDKAPIPNAAISVTRIINVIAAPDTTKPVISLTGATAVTVNQGTVYTDLGATAGDNVDGNLTPNMTVVNPVNTAVLGVYTVTYDVVDAAKNKAVQKTRVVTVVTAPDNTKPVITLLGLPTVTVVKNTVYTDAGATAFDNVDGALIPKITGVVKTAVIGTYTLTYNVSDAALNAAAPVMRTVIVTATPASIDNQAPVVTAPAAVTVEATGANTAVTLGVATVVDNVTTGLTATAAPAGPYTVGVHTITWTSTADAVGNIGAATQTVTVQDTTAPVVTAPGAVTIEATGAATAVPLGTATVADAVTAGLTATATPAGPYAVGVHTITWTSIADAAGNVGTAPQTVTVQDTTVPVFTGAPLAAVTAEAVGAATTVALTAPAVTDAFTVTITSNAPVFFPLGTTPVIWTATDANGQVATTTQNVVVSDTIVPVFTGAPLGNVAAESTGVNTSVTLTPPTVTDVFTVTVTNNAPATFPLGTTVVVWTATDANGLSVTTTQNVVVSDTTAPVFTGAPLVDLVAEATGVNTTVVLTPPAATDAFTVTVTNNAPVTFPMGTTVVTWTATDANGLFTTATQNIVVSDTTAPVFSGTPLADVLASTTTANATVVLTPPAANDIFTVTVTNNATVTFPIGTTVVIWTATDANAQVSTVTQNVIVSDTGLPVVTAPGAMTVEATGGTTVVNLGIATVTDNSGATLTATASPTGPYAVGVHTITWSATDAAANTGTAVQTVTVQDTTLPVITLNPLLGSVLLNSTFADPGAIAADVVDGNVNVVGVGAVNTAILGTYTLNYDYTDAATNPAVQVVRTVNVVNAPDTTPPVVTAPAAINIEATGATTPVTLGVATVTDNLDVGLIATADLTGPFTVGVHTITWTTTDAAGNPGTATQIVTINDTTAPTLALTGIVTVTVALNATYTDAGATASDIVDGNISGNIVVTGAVNTAVAATYMLTFDVSDAANNPALTLTRTVIVQPATPPVAPPAVWDQTNWDQSNWQ